MSFDQELREYLERVDRAAPRLKVFSHRDVDENDLHAHLLARLREPGLSVGWVRQHHRTWANQVGSLARYLERLPPQVAPVEPAPAAEFARRVLDTALELHRDEVDVVTRLEHERILAEYSRWRTAVDAYALENRLTSRDAIGSPVRVSRVGGVFARLRGRDAVRWLLTLEVAQSRGSQDRWRASTELLKVALSRDGITKTHWQGEEYFPYSDETLSRLMSMNVLTGWLDGGGEDVYRYTVNDGMKEVVQLVLEPGPWHSAVAALLEDDASAVVPLRVLGSSATDANLELSRLITHEVRNALVPVRHHIDAMIGGADPKERGAAARRGVVRVLDFVEQLATTSELISEPETWTDFQALAEEARARVEGGDRVEVTAPVPAVRIRGPRSRLVLVLSNVLLNALQSAPNGPIRFSGQRVRGALAIAVEDSGPGVPLEYRKRVFDDGFTTRDGGSGFGLALARRLVEEKLAGKIWCEDADLGGARFVLELPEARVQS